MAHTINAKKDPSGIEYVIHMEMPKKFTDFIQMAGIFKVFSSFVPKLNYFITFTMHQNLVVFSYDMSYVLTLW